MFFFHVDHVGLAIQFLGGVLGSMFILQLFHDFLHPSQLFLIVALTLCVGTNSFISFTTIIN